MSNVPTAVDDATADTTLFLMLGALRGFNQGIQNLRNGKWLGHPPLDLGHDPEGKILGILGMGGIGRNLKAKAEAFGMKVQYFNRNELPEEKSGGAKYVGFEELLSTSDVISLNLPLNVSAKSLMLMIKKFQLLSSVLASKHLFLLHFLLVTPIVVLPVYSS